MIEILRRIHRPGVRLIKKDAPLISGKAALFGYPQRKSCLCYKRSWHSWCRLLSRFRRENRVGQALGPDKRSYNIKFHASRPRNLGFIFPIFTVENAVHYRKIAVIVKRDRINLRYVRAAAITFNGYIIHIRGGRKSRKAQNQCRKYRCNIFIHHLAIHRYGPSGWRGRCIRSGIGGNRNRSISADLSTPGPALKTCASISAMLVPVGNVIGALVEPLNEPRTYPISTAVSLVIK